MGSDRHQARVGVAKVVKPIVGEATSVRLADTKVLLSSRSSGPISGQLSIASSVLVSSTPASTLSSARTVGIATDVRLGKVPSYAPAMFPSCSPAILIIRPTENGGEEPGSHY